MEDEEQKKKQQQQQVVEYRPRVEDGAQRAEPMSIDQCDNIKEMDDSQLVGAPAADVAKRPDLNEGLAVEVRNEVKVVVVAELSTGKRRRGRPPRNQGKVAPQPPPQRMKKDEEDVCFICFDGGSLVLCDRRGCPKAYHPSCIKRDEAFFRSKAKWNCGWHICSSCQKASYYMCYTCTFSLCKGCIKDADYVSVRGTKGFCGTCMKTIMLIENVALGNKESVQVDFDDKTSWEYLFKVYWIYLKEKLCLTLDELTKAKNPWKGDELHKAKSFSKGAGTLVPNGGSSSELYLNYDEKSLCLDNCFGNLEANDFKRRKTTNQPDTSNEENSINKSNEDKAATLPIGTTWATKELLEFVAHMRNGDTSIITQFDAQALLQEYIKRNNLRDPRQKCQIVCDSRLLSLFRKARVGHLEMLKLLEYHFLGVEKPPSDDTANGGVADVIVNPVEVARSNDGQLTMGNDRKRKTRRKIDEKGPPINANPDEYAAINFHNINLVYLKRNLIENLMDDAQSFHGKVVGSFVRIRISGGDQKQDMYRLVQVVGTRKAAESYSVGAKVTDVMLEILNLDKKEVVSIDGVSSQDFSEDECIRLRQSMKCGLIRPLKVGEVQEKAITFRDVKVSELLEAEILRLNHLRDRASEKGHKKELRECVEKLELLKSPLERQRRLLEIPTVHADPHMDPSYESEKDAGESNDKKQGEHVEPRNSGVSRKRSEISFSKRGGDVSNDKGSKAQKNLATCEESGNISTTFYADRDGTTQIHGITNGFTWSQGEAFRMNSQNIPKNQVALSGSATGDHASSLRSSLPTGRELFLDDIEMDNLWHYQDPTGKIQGPFSMMQLRKWSSCELFPLELRVWKINEKQDSSILLTNALAGQFHKEVSPQNRFSLLHEVMLASNDTDIKWENRQSQNTNGACVDRKKDDDASVPCNDDNGLVRRNELASQSSSQTTVTNIPREGQAHSSVQDLGLSKASILPDPPRMANSLPSPPRSGKLSESPLLKVREGHVDETWSSCVSNTNDNLKKTTEGQTSVTNSDEKQVDAEGHSSHSSGQNWRPPPLHTSSSGWNPKCDIASVAKPTETSEQNRGIDFAILTSPIPKHNHEQSKCQAAENKQSVSSNVVILDSGPSWSTASSLMAGRAQLPDIAGEWATYSPNPAKPTVEGWDSNIVSASSLKPTEGDHAATPTSGNNQVTNSSSNHPAIVVGNWHSIVPEATEFCSLVDESVSDLLAEVEAMESMGGLPSPTSKMTCGELAPVSDDDCFSPVDGFSPVPDPGKSDALSSTNDIQMPSQLSVADLTLRLSHYPPQLTLADATLGSSRIPSHSTVPGQPLRVSHVPSQSTVSQMHSRSTLTDEAIGLSQTHGGDRQKSLSGLSASSAEVEGDMKPSDVSVNQWGSRSKIKPPPSSTSKQGEAGSEIEHPRRLESQSEAQCPAPSMPEGIWGTVKGYANLSRAGTTQGSTDTSTIGGPAHWLVQQHTNTNSANSTANSGRYSGSRDHRNHYQGRGDSTGFGRDRSSSWNKQQQQQPLYGTGTGGSYRHPPKGQRVCKFYENGYCKKGASCSFWHP